MRPQWSPLLGSGMTMPDFEVHRVALTPAAMEPAPWERDDGSLKRSRMTCVFVAPCERRLPGFRIASTDGVVKVRNRWLTSTRALPRSWVTTTALAGSDDDRA